MMFKTLNIPHTNTNYTKQLISLLLFVAAFLFIQDAAAQTYPVQTNVYVSPPYGKHLNDYYSTTKERLVVSLLNRDNLKPVLEVRLRMTITASNGLKIQSKEEVNYPTITLDAGIPTRLTQDDLSPYFLNINSQGYFDQGKLPDGQVEFTFQVVEKYTNKILSAPATGRVWLSSQKPPLLRLPSNDESVAFHDPMNMKFQWEPQHKNLSQVEYEFELRELPGYTGAPQSVFMYAPVILQERLLYTSLIYDVMMPPLDPNKTYGWRVRAIAKDGIDELNMFENNGYSEIRWFRTQNDCPAPSGVRANLDGRRIDLTWTPGMGNVDYLVQYRPKYGTSDEWSELNAYEPKASIYDVQRGMTYEYRVGGICMAVGQPVFSPVGEIMVPAVDSTRLRNCGIMPPIDFSNKELLPELKVGDVVMLSDYPMTVTHVTGANGIFSGEGWVPVNWVLETKWAVEFTSITINTDYRMIAGSVKSQYDETWSGVHNGDKILGGGTESTADGIIRADVDITFVIPDNPVFEYNEEKGEVIVYTTDNQEPIGTIVLPKNEGEGNVFPVTVKDKSGKIYKLEEETDENGDKKITSTQIGESGDPISLNDAAKQNISTDIATITFERGNGQYAFDEGDVRYQKIAKIKNEYEVLADGKDGYLVPWKFLPVGGSDKVQAKIASKNEEIDLNKIVFATPQGTHYTAKYDEGSKTFTIDLVAGISDDVQEIYALYKESSQSYKTLGKLKVITYQRQVNKLVVVQVGGNTIDGNSLKEYLKKVYAPVGITWEVSVETYDYKGNTENFFEKNSGILSAYNGNMKNLQSAYKKHKGGSFDKNTAYVFIMGESGKKNDRNTQGFMPKGKQFGYIFKKDLSSKDNIYQVISHELAHGRWKLPHSFDVYGNIIEQGKTKPHNLMDYTSDGIHLAKWQWNIINNPALFSNPFESDEAGMAIGKTSMEEAIKETLDISIMLAGSTTFMTPAGTTVTLPENYELVSFATSFPQYIPNGSLTKFTIEGKWWLGHYGNNYTTFLGYISEEEQKKGNIVYFPIGNTHPIENVTLGFRDDCSILLKNYYIGNKELFTENKVQKLDYFKNLSDTHIIGEPIYDMEACNQDKYKFKIYSLEDVEYEIIIPTNSKYRGRKWNVPYNTEWSSNYKNSNIDFYYQIDKAGISLTPNMELNPMTTSVKRPVFVKINSPMTLDAKIKLVENSSGTKYYDEIYGADIYTTKEIVTESFAFYDYITAIEKWKDKNYKPVTDPDFQSPANVENLARAILKDGVLNPTKIGELDLNKVYLDDEYYYSGEEYSYYLFGYAANKYFNFFHVDWGRAFAMQYLNAKEYNPRTYGSITDAPWLVKAFNRGWANANGINDGYAPSMYEEYDLDEEFLTDGLTTADMIEVSLWIYGAGSVRKITVKVMRDAIIGAYINWQVQIALRMICGVKFEEAVESVDYGSVAWSGLTSVIENDKTIMALNCVQAAIDEYDKSKEINISMGTACIMEIIKHRVIKKLISDRNSPFGKYLYENLKKKDHSKTEFLRQICIIFNCKSDTALEIMRIIPAEITNTMHEEWEVIEELVKEEMK
ncbi:fibronectin type III domain-containing protein [Dysgonomonas sp. 25]|uniref:fibronectin type III domain-containing protein n=1 Tax=Dysgonomonas sp. 25 TaxID=2302933 RepID=UPI0013CFA100|nr:fibronectin type III domain-containing protein [Dysgonomonas sp. 25]NDV70046.1 hypothetical protein [Dysgonomonas sp. 25]